MRQNPRMAPAPLRSAIVPPIDRTPSIPSCLRAFVRAPFTIAAFLSIALCLTGCATPSANAHSAVPGSQQVALPQTQSYTGTAGN